MIESSGKLDRLRISGNAAEALPLDECLHEPTGVAVAHGTAYVLEGRLSYVFSRDKRGRSPALPFQLEAVPLAAR